jgi:hypothetical protein
VEKSNFFPPEEGGWGIGSKKPDFQFSFLKKSFEGVYYPDEQFVNQYVNGVR